MSIHVWKSPVCQALRALLQQFKKNLSLVSCSLFSCLLTAGGCLGLLIRGTLSHPVTLRVRIRSQWWRRRTGQRGRRAETVWCVRMQQWTGCCCPADTPACVTAACPFSSTAPSVEPLSRSRLHWHSNDCQWTGEDDRRDDYKDLSPVWQVFWLAADQTCLCSFKVWWLSLKHSPGLYSVTQLLQCFS